MEWDRGKHSEQSGDLSNDGETAPANLLVWPSGSLGFPIPATN